MGESIPKGESGDELAESRRLPWEGRTSIYAFLRGRRSHGKGSGNEDEIELPDEVADSGERVRFGAGVMDGIATHHMGVGKDIGKLEHLYDGIVAYCTSPTVENKKGLYETILQGRVIGVVDPLLRKLNPPQNAQRVHELGRFLAMEAPDREPVKLGIALLGLFANAADREIFFVLGSHDEFTLFAAVALSRFPTAEADLWELAKNVHGWGRIHTVKRLATTQDAAIKAWLLREGYRNKVMNEYLALSCARGGGLARAVAKTEIDEALFDGAGEILEALIVGGPAGDITLYEDAPVAVGNYLMHAERTASTIHHISAVSAVTGYLKKMENPTLPWTIALRDAGLNQAEAVLRRPAWRGIVERGLISDNDQEFFLSARAAAEFGIDTWEHHWRRLLARPLDQGRWLAITAQCDASRIGALLEVARAHLPLGKIATGPTKAIGVGSAFEIHLCVNFLLRALRQFPGHGGEYVLAALRSPTVRNRRMAAAVLKDWERNNWPGGTEDALRAAVEAEPKDDVRGELAGVFDG